MSPKRSLAFSVERDAQNAVEQCIATSDESRYSQTEAFESSMSRQRTATLPTQRKIQRRPRRLSLEHISQRNILNPSLITDGLQGLGTADVEQTLSPTSQSEECVPSMSSTSYRSTSPSRGHDAAPATSNERVDDGIWDGGRMRIASGLHRAQLTSRCTPHLKAVLHPHTATSVIADPGTTATCSSTKTFDYRVASFTEAGPSQPIAIPGRRGEPPLPTTPLTARYTSRFKVDDHFRIERLTPPRPYISTSLRAIYPRNRLASSFQRSSRGSPDSHSTCSAFSDPEHPDTVALFDISPQKHSRQKKSLAFSRSQPSGLSPTVYQSASSVGTEDHSFGLSASLGSHSSPHQHQTTMSRFEPSSEQQKKHQQQQSEMQSQAKPTGKLQMPALPRFHPAIYQSPSGGPGSVNPSPRSRQAELRNPLSPQLHQRQRSGPQQQLYNYQREMIANIARSPLTSSQPNDTPKAPFLHPCGSPGPATPLNLTNESDYLTAGMVGESSSRELVDEIIRNEKDRRNGISSGPVSPAVSPAGGRG